MRSSLLDRSPTTPVPAAPMDSPPEGDGRGSDDDAFVEPAQAAGVDLADRTPLHVPVEAQVVGPDRVAVVVPRAVPVGALVRYLRSVDVPPAQRPAEVRRRDVGP